MIHPLLNADGLPDIARMGQWIAACDHCPARTRLTDIASWVVGPHQSQAVYCPDCWQHQAARLIDPLFQPPGLPGFAYVLTQQARRLPYRARPTARRLARALTRALPRPLRHAN
ncbi:hypothetical protein [Actinomadura kijaniata]|uniref:hypothetical protein n=1 Tax=Actinomadura kijaniata TaxID=46161 RepID=UPI000833C57B|nr:hypothetical protein [Actinomadura kijaniata]